MKQFLFGLVFIIATTKAHSKTVEGYIVTLYNDTINVQIKFSTGFVGIGKNSIYKNIEVTKSSGIVKACTPTDISAYGYTEDSETYIYRSKPIKDGSIYFLKVVEDGINSSLYQYSVANGGGPGFQSSSQEFYTFEKSDGTYLFLSNYASLQKLKEQLTVFYKDYPEAVRMIDMNFMSRRDIQHDVKLIVGAVNGEY